jgi:hypothetical protein
MSIGNLDEEDITVETVGELREAIDNLPDDMLLTDKALLSVRTVGRSTQIGFVRTPELAIEVEW